MTQTFLFRRLSILSSECFFTNLSSAPSLQPGTVNAERKLESVFFTALGCATAQPLTLTKGAGQDGFHDTMVRRIAPLTATIKNRISVVPRPVKLLRVGEYLTLHSLMVTMPRYSML